MNLKPVADKVLVEVYRPESKSAGGLFLPEQSVERKYCGKVLSIGDSPDITVKPGDFVYYEKGMQYTVEDNKVVYDFVSCYDIIAVRSK